MNDNQGNRRPPLGLLLLIPAAVIIAKGASRRRAMWASDEGPAGRGRSHHHRFDGGRGDADRSAAFRLPPRLESVLDAWHTRTHEAADSPETPTSVEPSTV
jgi:hypothetical protein